MKKLFENIEGNKFKLLIESKEINEGLVASGLKKVFMNAGGSISYHQVECVGLGYIKDVNTAKKVALQEAREMMREFGYKDSEQEAKFVKDSTGVRPLKKENDETDMSNPSENREVSIGRTILQICDSLEKGVFDENSTRVSIQKIKDQVKELLKIHGQQ